MDPSSHNNLGVPFEGGDRERPADQARPADQERLPDLSRIMIRADHRPHIERPRAGYSRPARVQAVSHNSLYRGAARAIPMRANVTNISLRIKQVLNFPKTLSGKFTALAKAVSAHPAPSFSDIAKVVKGLHGEVKNHMPAEGDLKKGGFLPKYVTARMEASGMKGSISDISKELSSTFAKVAGKSPDLTKLNAMELQDIADELAPLGSHLEGLLSKTPETKEGKQLLKMYKEFSAKLKNLGAKTDQPVKGSSKAQMKAQQKVAISKNMQTMAVLGKKAKPSSHDISKAAKGVSDQLKAADTGKAGPSFSSSKLGQRNMSLVFKGLSLSMQKEVMNPMNDPARMDRSSLESKATQLKKLGAGVKALEMMAGKNKDASQFRNMRLNLGKDIQRRLDLKPMDAGKSGHPLNVSGEAGKKGVDGLWALKNKDPANMLDVSEAMVDLEKQVDKCTQESNRLKNIGYEPQDILMILPKECRADFMRSAMEELDVASRRAFDSCFDGAEDMYEEELVQIVTELHFIDFCYQKINASFSGNKQKNIRAICSQAVDKAEKFKSAAKSILNS
jgi:hypothetical protein